jgi:hypothetical protein
MRFFRSGTRDVFISIARPHVRCRYDPAVLSSPSGRMRADAGVPFGHDAGKTRRSRFMAGKRDTLNGRMSRGDASENTIETQPIRTDRSRRGTSPRGRRSVGGGPRVDWRRAVAASPPDRLILPLLLAPLAGRWALMMVLSRIRMPSGPCFASAARLPVHLPRAAHRLKPFQAVMGPAQDPYSCRRRSRARPGPFTAAPRRIARRDRRAAPDR